MFAFLMGLKSISPRELQQALQEQQAVAIYDVNSSQSWAAAHVPGAVHLDPMAYTEADLPADKTHALVFYCSNPLCKKAPLAARRAKQMGYSDVKVLSAGISGWQSAMLPTQGSGEVGGRQLQATHGRERTLNPNGSMGAKFLVERTFLVPSFSLFVVEGVIVEGTVQAGMEILIGFNRSYSMSCRIEGVEFVRRSLTEQVALTVRYEKPDEGEFLQSFNLSNEEVLISVAKT